jgi:dsRNA-specific ribonuclease
MQVGQFIESVKQEVMHDLATAPYGGSVVKAPKVLADIVEAIAAAVYVDCKFDLEKLWKVFCSVVMLITHPINKHMPFWTLMQTLRNNFD